MNTFTARYDGRCCMCDKRIDAGDEVRYDDDDDLVHARCEQPHPDAGQIDMSQVCPTCWLVHPGECE